MLLGLRGIAGFVLVASLTGLLSSGAGSASVPVPPAVSAHASSAAHLPVAAPRKGLPTERQWKRDVRAALVGSRAHVTRMAATGENNLAINLDIDNTALATAYHRGRPVLPVLRLAQTAMRHGVAVLFSTGRRSDQLGLPARALTRVGYTIDGLCGRRQGEPVVEAKQRCREDFAQAGFKILANVGNRPTDFVGQRTGRAYRLPGYAGRLG